MNPALIISIAGRRKRKPPPASSSGRNRIRNVLSVHYRPVPTSRHGRRWWRAPVEAEEKKSYCSGGGRQVQIQRAVLREGSELAFNA